MPISKFLPTVISSQAAPVRPVPVTPLPSIRVEFAWGTLVERRCQQFVIWDFCLVPLSTGLPRSEADAGLDACQWRVFQELERCFSCTARDLVTLLERVETWVLFPGTALGTFCQVVHFAWEQEARHWVVTELFPVLPTIIAQAKQRWANDVNDANAENNGRVGCHRFG